MAGSGDMGKGTECASLRMDGNPGFSSALMLSFFLQMGMPSSVDVFAFFAGLHQQLFFKGLHLHISGKLKKK